MRPGKQRWMHGVMIGMTHSVCTQMSEIDGSGQDLDSEQLERRINALTEGERQKAER